MNHPRPILPAPRPIAGIRLGMAEVVRQFGISRVRLLAAIRALEIYAVRVDGEWQFRWSDIYAWYLAQADGAQS